MGDDQYLVLFTVMSFTVLSAGSIVLSLLTRLGRGNRVFALIMGIFSIGMGAYMWLEFAPEGLFIAILGLVALVLAVLPSRKKNSDE
ncbi:MAG: hypothetical protein RJB56_1149 [Actinomycetota bacterium]|jgi:hypothetical protein